MLFKKIDHIEIVTERLEPTVRFYTDVLGFKERSRQRIPVSHLGSPMDLVYLELGNTMIELIQYPGAQVKPEPEKEYLGYRMMALEVEDMQKALDYLKTHDVAASWGPIVREGLYARAEIKDPNGFSIELRQWF